MSELSWAETRRTVYNRAHGCCEYCRTCEANSGQILEVEHINPSGGDGLDNLCLACGNCNRYKGKAIRAADPETGVSVALFNPRQQRWLGHFRWAESGARVEGVTPIGRATVERLNMNRDTVVTARTRWIIAGHHPPTDTTQNTTESVDS